MRHRLSSRLSSPRHVACGRYSRSVDSDELDDFRRWIDDTVAEKGEQGAEWLREQVAEYGAERALLPDGGGVKLFRDLTADDRPLPSVDLDRYRAFEAALAALDDQGPD